jgi:DNA replication initiation complex subunit (GINS family)
MGYNEIRMFWKDEKNTERLLNLEDLKLSKMSDYLSQVRQMLAETPSGNVIQVDLLQEEGVNIEFMIKDLLMIRRQKIIAAALKGEKPSGSMTLAEEEFHTRLVRGLENHAEFVNDIVTGKPTPTITKTKPKKEEMPESVEIDDDSLEYIMVRFLRPVGESVMGLDEVVYGPFRKEDIATIPIENARIWLGDGTVTRIVPTNDEDDE